MGAVGPKAEKAASTSGVDLQVVLVPHLGDPAAEMARVLERSGLRCGLRLEAGSAGSWQVERFGDCGPLGDHTGAGATSRDTLGIEELPAPSVAAEAPPPGLEPNVLFDALRAHGTAPDPSVAFWESMIFGFGTGHFYSGNRREGFVHLGIQASALLLAGPVHYLGTKYSLSSPDSYSVDDHVNQFRDTRYGGAVIVTAGLLVLARGVDAYRAPLSARDETYRRSKGK